RVHGLRLLNAALESGPACESVFARDGQLRIVHSQMGGEDFSVGGFCPSRMKFADALRHCGGVRAMALPPIFLLISKMHQIGSLGKRSYRHTNFLSSARGPPVCGQKVSSYSGL